MNLPEQAPRPGLDQFAQAGDEWQSQKIQDLARYFGEASLLGQRNPITDQFSSTTLLEHLPQAAPLHFIVEAAFGGEGGTFARTFGLTNLTDSRGHPLHLSEFRPDLILVNPAQRFTQRVLPNGLTEDISETDNRLQLHVIDIKLTSDPSAGYLAETVLYAVALAGWLIDHHFEDRFLVVPHSAVWPGSHEHSLVEEILNEPIPPSSSAILDRLREDWVRAPFGVFVSRLTEFLRTELPEVLPVEWRELPWHVDQKCRHCEFLGYPWQSGDPHSQRIPDEGHCMPQAERDGHLSQIAFVGRGASGALRQGGIHSTQAVSSLDPTSHIFLSHHGLRQSRNVVSNRARALTQQTVLQAPQGTSSPDLPRWADLNIYLTVDFEVSQAITFALGYSCPY